MNGIIWYSSAVVHGWESGYGSNCYVLCETGRNAHCLLRIPSAQNEVCDSVDNVKYRKWRKHG